MIKHIRGDITKLDADILVNSVNTKLTHDNGIAKVIAKAAGYQLVLESEALQNISIGDIAMTKAGNLKYDHIYHIPTINLEDGTKISYEDLEKVWRKALTWCKANKFDSIASPLLGINAGLKIKKVEEIMIKVAQEYQFDNVEVILVQHEEVEDL